MIKKAKEQIINYFKKGETTRDKFRIGAEFEHFVIYNDTFNTVSYYGKNGVGESIAEICEIFHAKPLMDEEYILGFTADDFSVSTEPGSQFELSMNPQKNIQNLEKKYLVFMNTVLPVFKKKNQSLICLGYHPRTKIDEIKILPKKRYGYMYEHFKSKGKMAHNMMKGSASIQVAIDYEDEKDFKDKYFLGSAISPIFYTLFENSPLFESELYKKHNLRQKIWENTDDERSGLLKIAFDEDMSYGKYADFILNTTPIFLEKEGILKSAESKKLHELFTDADGEDLIFHALSIVFPDVRLKSYLEFRMFDSVKYDLNFSAIALVKGLFYSEKNIELLKEIFENATYDTVMKAKEESEEMGLETLYMGKTFLDYAKIFIEMAKSGLEEMEIKYLEPLENLINQSLTPHDKFFKELENDSIEELLMKNTVEVKNV
ncbi:glutamate-cysteine ligase family 2(GCS2) [Peptoniphilus sp. ING2-D1G]|nr:glutamate-cysteine ligase family 2(GCS2) [Peptoniphilus sp. ING2-D1G]